MTLGVLVAAAASCSSVQSTERAWVIAHHLITELGGFPILDKVRSIHSQDPCTPCSLVRVWMKQQMEQATQR